MKKITNKINDGFIKSVTFLRKTNKKTQSEVANYLGISQSAYQTYETGDSKPMLENLIKLADLYQVSLDYLVGREFGNGLGYMSEDQINFVKTFLCLNQTNQMKTIIYAANLLAKQ